MSRSSIRNAGGVPFLILQGHFIVRSGQQPDGDTLAFAASRAYQARTVKTNIPVDSSAAKTVNLRFQSIDAPEKKQPLGMFSRDGMLKAVGIRPAAIGLTSDFYANGTSGPVPGWVATQKLDGYQRPLSYLFTQLQGFQHGQEVAAEDLLPVLRQSLNFKQISSGRAFPAFYSNTEESHAVLFQRAAAAARDRQSGGTRTSIWRDDATSSGFIPTPDAVSDSGVLIYPKFYRRIAEWKTPRENASRFLSWLKTTDGGKKLVTGAEPTPIPLWQLFEKLDTKQVYVPYDVTKLWFEE